ncbi:hypothetical protein HB779_05985 [Phyllobacterium sp. 628]|uniref:hypothetical protein n=1 Tax=Phyllobacterium sp. 628 TaxID=2718938 RepID=UPI0016626933|nr:hypothetical protein [Phyllobacterium sp. 628]QND51497.1 hypothetical protein HB779_05985 [Phyllobacterium sp. 628]
MLLLRIQQTCPSPVSISFTLASPRASGWVLACCIALTATACTTTHQPAPRPATPVMQEDRPEPLSPDIKPLTVEQAEQVDRV